MNLDFKFKKNALESLLSSPIHTLEKYMRMINGLRKVPGREKCYYCRYLGRSVILPDNNQNHCPIKINNREGMDNGRICL